MVSSSSTKATKKAPAKKTSNAKSTTFKSKETNKTILAHTKDIAPIITSATCIIDNGGWEVKYGLLASNDNATSDTTTAIQQPSKMFNCTARPPHQLAVLVGDEILRMKHLGQLSYQHSLERGMVVDGSTQCAVWSRVLRACGVNAVPNTTAITTAANRLATNPLAGAKRQSMGSNLASSNVTVVLLEAPFVPSVISEGVDKILFRELGVGRVAKLLSGCMAAVKYLKDCRKNNDDEPAGSMGTDDSSQDKNSTWINDGTKCCCVVDSGYSFTHVIPTQSGAAVESAIRRLDIGGKVLTNLLKEAVTYRQWNMMDEYHIVNDAKEQVCFVSKQFNTDMKYARITRRGLRHFDREFLLPDFVNTFKGTVQLPLPLQKMRELEEDKKQQLAIEREMTIKTENVKDASGDDKIARCASSVKKNFNASMHKGKRKINKTSTDNTEEDEPDIVNDSDVESEEESEQQRFQRLKQMREQEQKRREAEAKDRQALALSVERFAIPEVLFSPSDLGLDCGGIADAIVESINACDPTLRAAMYHNVLLVGGNTKISGFKERVETELRKLAPVNYVVRVFLPNDPVSYSWEGAKLFCKQSNFQDRFSIDRIRWESMKKDGSDQKQIWGGRIHNNP